MIGMVAAVSQNGVIGVENKIPWDYREDMKHFRTTTANSVVVMGRKTFESIKRPLPKRRNIVISKIARALETLQTEGIETTGSLKEAIEMCSQETRNIWLIGGAYVYEAGMECADKILLTLTPDIIKNNNVVKFPWINPNLFTLESINPLVPDNKDCKLLLATYQKII